MGFWDWIIVIGIVLTCAGVIVSIRRRKKQGKGCCGDCSSCSHCPHSESV